MNIKKFLLVNFLLFLIIHSVSIYSQNSFNSLIDHGNARFAAGQFSEATELFQKAITLLKTERQKLMAANKLSQLRHLKNIIAHVYSRLIRTMIEMDEYKKAHDIYFEALKMLPDSNHHHFHESGAEASYYLGNIAFSDNDFSLALEYYNKVKASLAKNPRLINRGFWFGKTWNGIDAVFDALNIRIKLGNIQPKYTIKVAVVFIRHTKLVPGDKKYGKIPNLSLSEQTISRAWLNSKLLCRLIEVLSLGNLSIELKKIVVDSTVTKIVYQYVHPKLTRENPYWEYITPSLERLHFDILNKTDAFIYHWPNTSNLPARTSGIKYPIVPFHIYGPHRLHSLLPLSCSNIIGWALKLHEFFHIIEMYWGVPIHGFTASGRKKFPGWKGVTNDQWDYYKWVCANIIIPRAEMRVTENEKKKYRFGWKTIAASERGPLHITEEQYSYSHEKLKNIRLEDREQALKLADLAYKEWRKRNKEKSNQLYEQALQLNPYCLNAVKHFAHLAIGRKEYDKALKLIKKYLKHSPDWNLALNAGNIYFKHKNSLSEAEKYYHLALQTVNEPEAQAEVYLSWGRFLTSKAQWEEAAKLFNKAIQFDTRAAFQCRFHYGESLFHMGQRQEGIKWMKEAMEQNEHVKKWCSGIFKKLMR